MKLLYLKLCDDSKVEKDIEMKVLLEDLITDKNGDYEECMNGIDHAICEAEQEMCRGAEAVFAETVFEQLERKHFKLLI